MVMIAIAGAGAIERRDAFGGDNDRGLGGGCFHQPIEPTLDSEMVTKLGGAAIINLGANDDWVSLRSGHFCQLQSKLFGQQSARDFDETQIGNVMNNTTTIGIEKHHLHFRTNTGRLGSGHIGQ